MIVIGLTGGIASGKSTVSKILQKLGAKIIDADKIARDVVEPHKRAWQEIVEAFGKEILQSDLNLNRKKLGEIVFSNKEDLEKINNITHPQITNQTLDSLHRYDQKGVGVAVIDAALLIETGMHRLVDLVWVVKIDQKEQIRRLVAREKISEEEALKRIYSQTSVEEKVKHAQQVIDNSGRIEELEETVTKLWKELLNNDKKNRFNSP